MLRSKVLMLTVWIAGALAGEARPGDGQGVTDAEDKGTLMIHEDFSDGMDNWWREGLEGAWVEDGRLHMKADPTDADEPTAGTVWHRTPISGNVRIEMKAHVVSSTIGANNINLFLFYSDPEGTPLYDTRDARSDGGYAHYHELSGYIITFLRNRHAADSPDGDAPARFRLRRCPGFELVDQLSNPMSVKPGRTYNLTITRKRGKITFAVDGERYLKWEDPEPLRKGLLGLRTFRTHLWWDDIRVYQLND